MSRVRIFAQSHGYILGKCFPDDTNQGHSGQAAAMDTQLKSPDETAKAPSNERSSGILGQAAAVDTQLKSPDETAKAPSNERSSGLN
ncbi:hypothetical protein QE152_g4653 [Popillia japonica]|uniref:Uncharacterized protein n=1 Tax=Popillia japonica TaxID=7064 RepID=A0AAW1MZJ5_POPJA